MKKLIVLVLVLAFVNGFSQKTEVFEKMEEYGFSSDAIGHGLKDSDATHAFNLKTTTINGNKTEIEICHFDPIQPVGSKWVLDSHDGNKPTKKQIKKFSKSHNSESDANGRVDDASWKIVSDDDTYFVVSFKFEKESLPKKHQFLADCTGTAHFNKKSKTLEKATFVNNGPLHIKFFVVTKLDMFVTYKQVDGNFMIDVESMKMTVTLLDEQIDIAEKMEYSDYKKVK